MLSKCRALDLTNEKGFLCGKILADLGADVIKIEPPGGDSARNNGPFWHDIPDPEKSLYWIAYNSSKRGITLNISQNDGQDIFKALVRRADFILESYHPGYLESLDLGYSEMRKINPAIIMVSISPFGKTGPYKDYAASDMIAMAMSGLQYQTGQPEGPPTNVRIPQACLHAGADAAVGAMIAYYYRECTGKGQHVDVSMQQSTAYFSANAIPFWELQRTILKRTGHYRSGVSTATAQRQVWQCKDGFVFFALIPGKTGGKAFRALVEWMRGAGLNVKEIENIDWERMDMATITQGIIDQMTQPIEKFFLMLSKKELLEGSLEKNISLCPLSSMSDLFEDRHLASRKFWVDIDHPELAATLPYPREFVKSSEGGYKTPFRAPMIGEHNREVYQEIGLSKTQLISLMEAGTI
jgi:crotonobetainyl-CoA:carnitine CoA-transferase CaiB-like acyl-CoA transferase